uniref:Clr2_transil domain-containing protein n=1 Tax=Caenorhabditis tropicalis TaxID=1561998 RepID=A0A1I7TPD5_9PELO
MESVYIDTENGKRSLMILARQVVTYGEAIVGWKKRRKLGFRLHKSETSPSPHSQRPPNGFTHCFICGLGTVPSAIEKQFKAVLNNNKKKKTKSTRISYNCGEATFIPSGMHDVPSQALYLSLEQNYGSIKCPDHYCEICFTESREGTMIRATNQIRAFHPTGFGTRNWIGSHLQEKLTTGQFIAARMMKWEVIEGQ